MKIMHWPNKKDKLLSEEDLAQSILVRLRTEKELSLGEINRLLPKKFCDHRDFYVLSTLYSTGYIGVDMSSENDKLFGREDQFAEMLYTLTLGAGEHKYGIKTFVNSGNYEEVRLFYTGKADLYFSERKQRRQERIFVLIVGLIIAIISAYTTAYFTQLVNS